MEVLLEREDELDALAETVALAVGGRGSLVLLAGEAGAGKTSLVRALRERNASETAFFVGACEPLSVPLPLAPVREVFSAAANGRELTSEIAADDRLALALGVLDALAARAPSVAVIEDAHWADPTTVDVLRLMARRVEDARVAMIVTYRDDELAANPALSQLVGDLATSPAARRVHVGPLSMPAIRKLAARSGLDGVELARTSGGNPFLVVESIAAGGRLPASVSDAALARASRLGPQARRAVEAAAVIGQRVPPVLLEELVPGSGEAVEEALARGVLRADDQTLGFRHELIREALEDSISPARRRALHARVATLLAERSEPGRLAHHAELGGLVVEACRYAVLASAEAERMGALRETRLQAERALRLGGGLDDVQRCELLIRYSRAANFSSVSFQDAIESAEQAFAIAERLGDRLRQAHALAALAWALWSFDRPLEGKTAAQRAIEVLEGTTELAALARAHSTAVRMQATAFDPQAAVEAGPHALELARTAGLADVETDVAISVSLARGHLGERLALTELLDVLAHARAARMSIQVVRTYVNVAFLAAALREHELLDRILPEALAACEELNAPIPRHALEGYLARSMLDRGRWDEALAAVEACVRVRHGDVSLARSIDGLIAARRGDPGAGDALERAWGQTERLSEASRHATIRCALVEAAWLRDDRQAALAHLRGARASQASSKFARWGGELALWASRYGIELQVPPRAPVPVTLELAGDWRKAITAWQEMEAPYEAALAAIPGDERAAREAVGQLQRLGAMAAVRAFARERAARGARASRGPRRSTLANAAGLTRREQEVLEQLATGATNAAIAVRLHLSERTVAHHVSAILAKLSARNRLNAVQAARAKGLLEQGARTDSAQEDRTLDSPI